MKYKSLILLVILHQSLPIEVPNQTHSQRKTYILLIKSKYYIRIEKEKIQGMMKNRRSNLMYSVKALNKRFDKTMT